MTGDERVVHALARLGKACDAAELAQAVELLHAAREHFVHIALVANVKDEPVAAGVKHLVDGERRLDDAEIRRQMPARLCDVFNEKRADFPAKLRVLRACQAQQILPGMDGL